MMKSLEVERVRSRAAGDRDSDTIIDLRTALEIEREIRNGISGKCLCSNVDVFILLLTQLK